MKRSRRSGRCWTLIEEQITVFTCVASVYRYCARSLRGQKRFPKLRLIHLPDRQAGLGDEPVFPSDVELCRKHFADHWPALRILLSTAEFEERGPVRRWASDSA